MQWGRSNTLKASFCLVLAIFSTFPGQSSRAQSPAPPSPISVEEAQAAPSAGEPQANTFAVPPGPTDAQKKYLDDLQKVRSDIEDGKGDVRDALAKIAETQLDITNYIIAILGLAAAIVTLISGALAGAAVYYIRTNVLNRVVDEATRTALGTINKRVRLESGLVLAEFYGQLSFAWWARYEPEFQVFLRNPAVVPDIADDAKLAQQLAEQGLQQLEQIGGEAADHDNWGPHIYAQLKNHWTYNTVALLLLSKVPRGSKLPLKAELIQAAAECIALSRNENRLSKQDGSAPDALWYNF